MLKPELFFMVLDLLGSFEVIQPKSGVKSVDEKVELNSLEIVQVSVKVSTQKFKGPFKRFSDSLSIGPVKSRIP